MLDIWQDIDAVMAGYLESPELDRLRQIADETAKAKRAAAQRAAEVKGQLFTAYHRQRLEEQFAARYR